MKSSKTELLRLLHLVASAACLWSVGPDLSAQTNRNLLLGNTAASASQASSPRGRLTADDGYRGIWYYNQPTKDEYKFKYSGGFATYPQQHAPIAIYCREVDKTFFVYGGTTARSAKDKQELLHMISYYDHKTGQVPRPRILLNKRTEDAHDNPTLQVDDRGYLWVFSASHGNSRPSYIHRSTRPYGIDEFERVLVTNFSYTQPWHVPGEGFLFLHTRYGGGQSLGIDAARCLFFMTSTDGLLVYLKDVNFDREGRPVILFLTSKGFEPGPENGPREWQTLRWTGQEWLHRPFTASGNNYDHGSLYLEPDGTWRVIAPTELGAQPYNPGGQMVMWTSSNEGKSWKKVKQLTQDNQRNHGYARRPLNAHPDFYAFWADGHGREPSESNLYFTNQRGDHVWRLPAKMNSDFAKPEIAW